MSLVRNWKFYICLFLDILGLEIMSDDHLVKNQALVNDKKKSILNSRHIEIFSTLTHDFGQKIGNFTFVCFWINGPCNNV